MSRWRSQVRRRTRMPSSRPVGSSRSGPAADGCNLAWGIHFRPDMTASLTRTVTFHALHRYYRPDWTEARNREAFGPLADPPGHGHDYQCAVTVAGRLDPESGMITDLPQLD